MNHARSGNAEHVAHSVFAHPERTASALGIEHGMKVADFGAGSGAYVLALAERVGKSGRVYAVDVQGDLLRRVHNETAQRGYTNVDIIRGDLEKDKGSKIADHSLDFVLVSNILFQLEDKDAALDEAMRILKPSGRLAIIDWSESYGGMGPRKGDAVQMDEAYALAHAAGFSFLKEFGAGAHHYGLMFRKQAQKPR